MTLGGMARGMRQFELQQRVMNEERLWFAEYNKTVNGEITLIDEDNGQPCLLYTSRCV